MIAQSVADILNHHVKLTVEGIDRMYLNVFVPRLQHELGIVGFFREHRGQPLPSAALMKPMSRSFVAKLEDFVARHAVPLVQFRKGQRKDDVMKEHLRRFRKEEGVVFVGKAQEKTPSKPSTARSRPVVDAPRACASPMRASSRSCMPSSCSGYSPMAFVPPICAAISPLCRDAIPRRSPKAQSPISFVAYVFMA